MTDESAAAFDVIVIGAGPVGEILAGRSGTAGAHACDVPASGSAGASFVGPVVSERLPAATIAVVGKVSIDRRWDPVPAFPSRSEVWLKLLEAREAELASVAG